VFNVDGLSKKKVKEIVDAAQLAGGAHVELVGTSGKVWGAALRSTEDSTKPIIVSQGH